MSKSLIPFLMAGWVVAIAILAIQNATPVSLAFLGFTSIQIPLGVILAFSVALGMVATGLIGSLWKYMG